METEFGAVIFDSEALHDTGWACHWQGNKTQPVRIAGTGELSSGVVWQTNLGYEADGVAGLTGSRFRRGAYLHHEMDRLWDEVGLSPDYPAVDPAMIFSGRHANMTVLRSAFSAWLFRQTVLAADAIIPMPAPPLSNLVRGLHDRIIPASSKYFFRGKPSDSVIDALDQADQVWQPVSRNRAPEAQSRRVRLYVNRIVHSICLLNAPWPSGRWFDVPSSEIKSKIMTDPMAWVDANPMSIFRATVKQTHDRDMERLINFGANITKKSRQGYWITAHDFRRILPYCEIEISKVMSCDDSISGFAWLDRAQIPIDPDEIAVRSGAYSFNLFMDLLWRVMLRPPFDFKGKSSPAAAFLRSYDRSLLFPKVQALDELGVDIAGYGGGGVTVNVPPSVSMAELASIAVGTGFFPPFVPPGGFTDNEAFDLAMNHRFHNLPEAARRMEAAFLVGDLQTIIDMDDALFNWRAS